MKHLAPNRIIYCFVSVCIVSLAHALYQSLHGKSPNFGGEGWAGEISNMQYHHAFFFTPLKLEDRQYYDFYDEVF